MKKIPLVLVFFTLSSAFAQEGAIKFQFPLDSTGLPILPKQDTLQKLGLTSNRPLNLAELSAKDSTATFETYYSRLTLVQDSISATQKKIESAKKRTLSQMYSLEPKGEFETQAEFNAREDRWERDFGERMQRDSKPFTDRLAELERAEKKIEGYLAPLYCSLEIKTNPDSAAIYFNDQEIGTSPAAYNQVAPGAATIRVQKENYEPWDTTLTMQPAQKLKFNVPLREKSIFSKENEIDFPKILAKDTTVDGYRNRINRVNARIAQIDAELVKMLELQKAADVLRYKHEVYRNKLMRTIHALEDYIVETESQLITERVPNAQINLVAFDVSSGYYQIDVQSTANTQSPFHFAGWILLEPATAVAMNNSLKSFNVDIKYLNYPFVRNDSSSFYLAMKEFAISYGTTPLKTVGIFNPLSRFEYIESYNLWHSRADSLLNGTLKAQGLDLKYVLGDEKPDEAVTSETSSNNDGANGFLKKFIHFFN